MRSDPQQRERELRDAHAADYDAWYRATKGAWFEATERATARARLQVDASSAILDAGCGTGRIACDLARDARQVVGVDFSVSSLRVLMSEVRRTFREASASHLQPVTGDALRLPCADQTFDRVVSVQMIQHLPTREDRVCALAEMRRVLRERGRVALIVYRWGGAMRGAPDEILPNGLFRHAYTPRELRAELEDAGFQRVRVGGMLHLPQLARLGTLGTRVDLWLGNFSSLARFGLYLCAAAEQ